MSRKRLYLVDGMSQIYRAYFAIRNLRTSKGLPTNATYGFTAMLRKLIEDFSPDYVGVAFDHDGRTVRHEKFDGYKATRKPMPDELQQQIPYIRRVCEAFCVPIIEVPGYEADDVLGTLAHKGFDAGLAVTIVSSDKDMLQLVNEHVLVLNPSKENLVLDAARVVEKMGVAPLQIPDLLALMGDTIDNIPGAPGIGEKGARELIQTFGNVEAAVAGWQQVKRKTYQESLRDNAEAIRVSKELATICCDLPIELELDRLVLCPPDRKGAFELFAELEFKTLMREFLDSGGGGAAPLGEWVAADAARELLGEIAAGGRVFFTLAHDVTTLQRRRARYAAVVGEGERAACVDLDDPGAARAWAELAADERLAKVCWDSKLARQSQEARCIGMAGRVDDVMLMGFLTSPHVGDYSLRRWALDRLHASLPEELPLAPQQGLPLGAREAHGERLRRELEAVRGLYRLLEPELDALELRPLYERIELPLVPILAEMEAVGVRIDPTLLAEMSTAMDRELASLTARIYEAAGCEFNINSNKQIGEVLFERLNLPVSKRTRKTGGYSTDQAVLEELAETYEIPKLLLQYRQVAKLKSTYVDALPGLIHPQTGRVHTSFHQTGAATGRISSSDPNLQNIPIRTDLGRRIRLAFVAREGHCLISADYSQIELRVLAHLSGDPVLVEAFRNDGDIHTRTARAVWGEAADANPSEYRRRAKVINFGIVYGLSAFGLSQKLAIGREEAQAFIDAYFERHHGVRAWLDSTLDQARRTGQVRTLFGRIRPIPEILSRDYNVRNFAERVAVNSPIQGTAADLIKLAMIAVRNALREQGLTASLTLQVHDELVVETPEAEAETVQALLRREMEGVANLDVPLKVETRAASNWKDAK